MLHTQEISSRKGFCFINWSSTSMFWSRFVIWAQALGPESELNSNSSVEHCTVAERERVLRSLGLRTLSLQNARQPQTPQLSSENDSMWPQWQTLPDNFTSLNLVKFVSQERVISVTKPHKFNLLQYLHLSVEGFVQYKVKLECWFRLIERPLWG